MTELAPEPEVPLDRPRRVVAVIVVVTIVATLASYLAPPAWTATLVGGVFFAATHLLVLRSEGATVRAYGLALGGLFERNPLDPRRIARDVANATGWALGCFALIALPFFYGFRLWFGLRSPWSWRAAVPDLDAVLGQLLVIALPEEAFYRGYVQSSLERRWSRSIRVLGLPVTMGNLVTSAVFAVGHVLTIPSPARLAVFFPSLLFGALRTRTGGIGAGVLLHALANLLSGAVARGYLGLRGG
jgi:hypothetical protein